MYTRSGPVRSRGGSGGRSRRSHGGAEDDPCDHHTAHSAVSIHRA
jgi:hypothetical protein